MADNLTKSEAVQFIEGVLQIQSPFDKLKTDRAGFLNDVIMAFHQRVPFQSVTAIATPKPERRRLTFKETKTCMMTRQGGLCCEMNYFAKVLLETLGFKVYHVGCSVMNRRNSHLSTVVESLHQPGDLHLVDVGTGYPVFTAIPLVFERESPLYHTGFLTHKFLKEASGSIRWIHKAHPDYLPEAEEDLENGWFTFMVSDMVFRDIEYFAGSMENVRTVESGPEALTCFLRSLRAVDFRTGRLFAIKDTTILEEASGGKVSKKGVSSPEELQKAYQVYFPQFPMEIVQEAIQTVSPKFEN